MNHIDPFWDRVVDAKYIVTIVLTEFCNLILSSFGKVMYIRQFVLMRRRIGCLKTSVLDKGSVSC